MLKPSPCPGFEIPPIIAIYNCENPLAYSKSCRRKGNEKKNTNGVKQIDRPRRNKAQRRGK